MGYWNTRGLRGSVLEDLINMTNDVYRRKGLAIIQKIPTPIKPIEIDNTKRVITLAYFEQKSTVDYIGAVQGIPVCFDAKETSNKNLAIQNIHRHQIDFMSEFEKHGGLSFLLVNFAVSNTFFFMPFKDLIQHYERYLGDGRKSIAYADFNKDYEIKSGNGVALDYISAINKYTR